MARRKAATSGRTELKFYKLRQPNSACLLALASVRLGGIASFMALMSSSCAGRSMQVLLAHTNNGRQWNLIGLLSSSHPLRLPVAALNLPNMPGKLAKWLQINRLDIVQVCASG